MQSNFLFYLKIFSIHYLIKYVIIFIDILNRQFYSCDHIILPLHPLERGTRE